MQMSPTVCSEVCYHHYYTIIVWGTGRTVFMVENTKKKSRQADRQEGCCDGGDDCLGCTSVL